MDSDQPSTEDGINDAVATTLTEMTAVDDTPATATPDCAAEQALTTLSELSVIESSSSSSTGDFDAAPLPPPPPPITTTNSHPSRGSSSRNPDLGIEIPPRDVDETSGLSEECSPGSNAASPLPVVVGGRRRSEETGSSTKLPAVATREGSGRGERKDRRASTSAVEFAREHIQSFEHNLGRGHFFSSLATSLSVHSTSSGTKPSAVASPSGGTILRQGWLMKRGGVVPAWRKRWFTLEHSADGPTLTYGKDQHKASPTKSGKASSLKTIKLSASTQCAVVPTKKDREFEFKLSTSVDVAQREYFIQAMSGVEMNAWMAAIKGAIYDCQTLAFDELSEMRSFWDKAGIHGFLVHYGVRKSSGRNHVQTRVLELNFAESVVINTKRGESLTTLTFSQLRQVNLLPPELEKGWGYGVELLWDAHRSWPCYLETESARDDLCGLLQHILDLRTAGGAPGGGVSPDELGKRFAQLTLKTGTLDRKNGSHNATIKGRFHVKLHEAFLAFFPEAGPYVRPWFVLPLRGLAPLTLDADRCMITLGRHVLVADSTAEAKSWYNALVAASVLPKEIIDAEMDKRDKIRRTTLRTVLKLRKLLKAKVQAESHGPPEDHKLIDVMLRQLWRLVFPEEPYVSNTDVRWQEIGFQRGGPASDLRSSGLLGLHCLIYFIKHHPKVTNATMNRIRFGVSDGNLKNYPFAIACINVVATLVEMLGLGDAGSHTDGCSVLAPKTFVVLVANEVDKHGDSMLMRKSMYGHIGQYESWDELSGDSINSVFEDLFCLVFPILDRLFVEMGAVRALLKYIYI
ncbi:hypothetical protein, variant [Aphanomyces astaci]|uniref:ELMO domain-containing protein n=1 Tax=Aphanomyces astaci TaxID=112090 RepID=W4GWZ9_APHAT|nr:hypothetical protein, variant [Aphanomyces astaci]ETV83539.1 hypothetical protein, variant [Aphanomyces astaci]|eukprot:XP_009826969.1 hypothetical protein, variant [Aphanomyces astaci]